MKALVVGMMSLVTANAAFADGFVCQTVDGSLNIKVFNHVQAEEGTRNAAVMVLSDPAVSSGRKTIARFTDVNGTLDSESASFVADVDLRFADSRRKGELILGTKLGELDQVYLDLDYSYNSPVEAGEEVEGQITLVKRNGKLVSEDVLCTRYLKSE
jgi:hypothetical protein